MIIRIICTRLISTIHLNRVIYLNKNLSICVWENYFNKNSYKITNESLPGGCVTPWIFNKSPSNPKNDIKPSPTGNRTFGDIRYPEIFSGRQFPKPRNSTFNLKSLKLQFLYNIQFAPQNNNIRFGFFLKIFSPVNYTDQRYNTIRMYYNRTA